MIFIVVCCHGAQLCAHAALWISYRNSSLFCLVVVPGRMTLTGALVTLPVAAFLKCLQNLSIRKQPLLLVLDMLGAGWVGIRPSQGLLKMTEDPAYCS